MNHPSLSLWPRFLSFFLGIWLLSTPFSFTYHSYAMCMNDMLCGLLIAFFSLLALGQRTYFIGAWGVAAVGIWLQFAPLCFWAPDAFTYINDTLVGVLAILLSIAIPGALGEQLDVEKSAIPAGWSYNPSAWAQRLPIIILVTLCWFFARYMGIYQLGYLNTICDPMFGENGTIKVITSALSRAFPVSDAGLGASMYALEALMCCKGGPARWRTAPWMVISFGLFVVPVGVVSILLIICQPVVVGYWCFWCLLTAICMLTMVALTLDEVAAVFQLLMQAKERGVSRWQTFWHGCNEKWAFETKAAPLSRRPLWRGVSLPWNLALSLLMGLLLLLSPILGYSKGMAADASYITAAITLALSCISIAEPTRSVRWLNLFPALYVLLSTWIFPEDFLMGRWWNIIFALLLAFFTVMPAKTVLRYGAWQKLIH